MNSDVIDTRFKNNARVINDLKEFLLAVERDSFTTVTGITLSGNSSPEGNYEFNKKLSIGRLNAVRELLEGISVFPDSIIRCNDGYIQWDSLKAYVLRSGIENKEGIVSIIDEKETFVELFEGRSIDSRVVKLKKADRGRAWRDMYRNYFGHMRSTSLVIINYERHLPPTVTDVDTAIAFKAIDDNAEIRDFVPVEIEQPRKWSPKLHVKTNMLFYSLLIPNIELEADFAKHWSVALPVSYSAINYFTSRIKFRTLLVQPELRYWFDKDNSEWFVGAHFTCAQFNIAANGEYRYQDHKGKAPALGGGVAFGYRMPISKNNRWNIEFSAGAGVYSIHYDKFLNTPDVKDGLYVGSDKFVYWGIDKLAVSVSYSFNLKGKGGRK